MTVLTVGLIVLAAGLLAAAVVSAIRPPRVGRWYGLLFVVAGIANVPIGPAEIAAVLNFVVFLGIAYVTARELALRGTPEYRVSGA